MTETCQRCHSGRVLSISAKCRDPFDASLGETEYVGYVLVGIGIDDGDDTVAFSYCLECGQIQGDWPMPRHATLEQGHANQDSS